MRINKYNIGINTTTSFVINVNFMLYTRVSPTECFELFTSIIQLVLATKPFVRESSNVLHLLINNHQPKESPLLWLGT